MLIIKEKVKYNGNNMNLKITLGSHDNFIGYQQEIDNAIQTTSIKSINESGDGEIIKYKLPTNSLSPQLSLNFFNDNLNNYSPNYTNAGFTDNELTGNTLNVRNSFWIIDYYDNFDSNNQRKIFTTYLTKINNTPNIIINDLSNQLYYWYIPKTYINSITGTTVNGYSKISFFNAKTGKIHLFYNQANESMNTGQKIYFETTLNLIENTWIFTTSNTPNVIGKELINVEYLNRVNNSFNSFNDEYKIKPTGNTYNYKTNTYLII